MSYALNNITAPDAYTTKSTLVCPDTARVRFQVNNQAIFWQRGEVPPGGSVRWLEPEEFLLPCVDSLDEVCDAIRIRAAIPAASLAAGETQAQVTITTRTAAELPR